MLKNSDRTAQETIPVSLMTTRQLQVIFYWEIIALYSEILAKDHVNTLCGQMLDFFNVELDAA
jgi:hypothetical protein